MVKQSEKYRAELNAGIFIIAVISIFIFGVLWLRYFALAPEMTIKILFDKPGVLNEGFRVYYQGVEVGKISRIGISKDMKKTIVYTDIYREGFTLPKNSTGAVIAEGIAGQKYIALNYPENPSKEMLEDGDSIRGLDTFTITDIQNSLKELIEKGELDKLVDKTNKLFDLQLEMTENLNEVVNANKKDFGVVVKNISQASDKVSDLVVNLNDLISDKSFKSDITKTFKNTSEFSEKINRLAGNENLTTTVDNAAVASANIKELSENAKLTGEKADVAMNSINKTLDKVVLITENVDDFTKRVNEIKTNADLFENVNETFLKAQKTLESFECLSDGISEMLSKRFLLIKLLFGRPGAKLDNCDKPPLLKNVPCLPDKKAHIKK